MFPNSPSQDPNPAPRWVRAGFSLALLLACAIALSPNMPDPDLWGHVQYGQDLLADRALPATATHTFTAADHRWINHENLSELGLAVVAGWWGAVGLMVVKCLLGVFLVGLLIRAALRQQVGPVVLCGFLLLVVTTLTWFWAPRPQLATYFGLTAMVLLLDRAFRDWQTENRIGFGWLWCFPFVLVAWTNAHGGFIAGFLIFGTYLGSRCLESIYRNGWQARPHVLHLSAIVACSAACMLLNPYGHELLAWVLGSLSAPRPEITEWAKPAPKHPFFWPMVGLITVSALAWCFTERRRDRTEGLILAIILWQALSHCRHVALLAILAGFWLPRHVQSLADRLRRGAPEAEEAEMTPRLRRALATGLLVAVCLLGAELYDRLSDMPVNRQEYPVDALQYMADQELSGRLLVAFNWAQYAIAALQPETQVSFDGRFRTCYPQELIDLHFDFMVGDVPGGRYRSENSGSIVGSAVLTETQPDLVLVDRRFDAAEKVMEEDQTAYVLLYQDGVAQLWAARSRYDNPAHSDFVAVDQRPIGDQKPEGTVTWPALPARSPSKVLAQQAPSSPPQSKDES